MVRCVCIAVSLVFATGCSLIVGDDDGGGDDADLCGTVGVVRDDFEGGSIDRQWRSIRNGNTALDPEVIGGVLELTYQGDSGTSGDRDTGVESRFGYRLSGQTVTVRVLDYPGEWDLALEMLGATDNNELWVAIEHNDGSPRIVGYFSEDGLETQQPGMLDYDPERHKYLVLSEQDGLVSFGASSNADGSDFDLAASGTLPFPMEYARPALRFFRDGVSLPNGLTGTARLDEMNTGRDPVPVCGVDLLDDEFDARLPVWNDRSGNEGSIERTGGAAILTVVDDATRMETATAFDLRGAQLVLEIEALPDVSSVDRTVFALEDVNGDRVAIEQTAGDVAVGQIIDNVRMLSSPTNVGRAGRHVWTISENGGLVELVARNQAGDEARNRFEATVDVSRARVVIEVSSMDPGVDLHLDSITGSRVEPP